MNTKVIGSSVLLIIAVVGLSILSVMLWGGKSESVELGEIVIQSELVPISSIASDNNIPLEVVLKALQTDSLTAQSATLQDLGISFEEAQNKIKKSLIIYLEHESKNWIKIFLKFLLWIVLLPIPVILIAKKKMAPKSRKLLYLGSLIIFGVVLGADPSPMGTVKDAVFLISAHQTVFWPRIIALGFFLLTVVLSTKLICSWGCQFGTLQDFLFRLGRNKRDQKGIIKQYKVPFWISNSIRITLFIAAVVVGFYWTVDIVGLIDPFRIYKPLILGVLGISFIVIVLIASLFVYRPWCHFACPFGLVSWFFEKLAIFRIKVDYSKCDACQACNSACPSPVMDAILKQDKVIPDCFGCGVCVEVCPTEAISLTSSRQNTGDYSDALQLLKEKRRRLQNKS